MPALFAETVTKLQPGDVSPVLRSAGGFHIVRLDQRRGGAIAGKPVLQTHARHILIKVTEIVPDDEAKRKLDVLKDRLDHGGDFAELAKSQSNDLVRRQRRRSWLAVCGGYRAGVRAGHGRPQAR